MGIDNIHLKFSAPVLFQPIHHLFLKSLFYQSLTLDWKTCIISPVSKSGNKSAVNNYHPISLSCVVSKVLERIIFNKISDFITEAISPNQLGFLSGWSCTQQILLFLNDIYDSAENNTQTDVLYLDFRKAFDTIPHNKLLEISTILVYLVICGNGFIAIELTTGYQTCYLSSQSASRKHFGPPAVLCVY